MKELKQYFELLNDIKSRVRQGQLRVNLSANAEMLATYWDVGKMIHEKQKTEGWGAGVIPRLAIDLKNELSEVKGFSERNLLRMVTFFSEYSDYEISPLPVAKLETRINPIPKPSVSELENKPKSISQQAVDQIQQSAEAMSPTALAKLENENFTQKLILSTKWANHIILIQKVKDLPTRYWYMQQCINNGWSRDTLSDMIKSKLHERQGKSATNFELTLPPAQSELAKEMLKDPYIFDFATLRLNLRKENLSLSL